MAIDVYLKRNDTREPLEVIAREADESGDLQPLPFGPDTAVRFHMVQAATNEFTDQPMPSPGAIVVNDDGYTIPATDGGMGYQWKPPDTALAGTFYAEFQLTFSDGRVLTFPNRENIIVHIDPDLA